MKKQWLPVWILLTFILNVNLLHSYYPPWVKEELKNSYTQTKKLEGESHLAPIGAPELTVEPISQTLHLGQKDGLRNKAISNLQQFLCEEGYETGLIDGKFGKRTQIAVKAYQKDHRLYQSGSIDNLTINRMNITINWKENAEHVNKFVLVQKTHVPVPASLGFTVMNRTPYDPYFGTLRTVIARLGEDQPSMDNVRQLMHEGKSFKYSFTDPYVPASPQVTESTHEGDCKAKSLWLMKRMSCKNVRFVVGKARTRSTISHAWLEWSQNGKMWILDCTNSWEPIPRDAVSNNEYIPIYSYDYKGEYKYGKYEKKLTGLGSSKRG